jgi:hypothetical protein
LSVSCDRSVVYSGFLHQKNWSPRSLQSQESLNRPVFVLDSLNRVLTLLNMYWTDSEQYWTDSEQYWTLLNRFWTLMNILNRVWTFWTWTEQIVNITDNSKHRLNRFWTLLNILNIAENSEQIHFSLNFSFSLLNQYILFHFH